MICGHRDLKNGIYRFTCYGYNKRINRIYYKEETSLTTLGGFQTCHLNGETTGYFDKWIYRKNAAQILRQWRNS